MQVDIDNEKHRARLTIQEGEWKTAEIGKDSIVAYDESHVAMWVLLLNLPEDSTNHDVVNRLAELSLGQA